MKYYCLLIIILFSTGGSYAQSAMPGYYIDQKNDTVRAEIKIRKGFFGQRTTDVLEEVEIIDSMKGIRKFTPADIKEYGFYYKGGRYRLVSKPVKNGSYKFLEPVFVGAKSSLYQYTIHTSGGLYASHKVYYTFEKEDGTYLFLINMLNKKFKSQVKEFYKDNTEVQQLIETKLKYWLDLEKDLKEILQAANKP